MYYGIFLLLWLVRIAPIHSLTWVDSGNVSVYSVPIFPLCPLVVFTHIHTEGTTLQNLSAFKAQLSPFLLCTLNFMLFPPLSEIMCCLWVPCPFPVQLDKHPQEWIGTFPVFLLILSRIGVLEFHLSDVRKPCLMCFVCCSCCSLWKSKSSLCYFMFTGRESQQAILNINTNSEHFPCHEIFLWNMILITAYVSIIHLVQLFSHLVLSLWTLVMVFFMSRNSYVDKYNSLYFMASDFVFAIRKAR